MMEQLALEAQIVVLAIRENLPFLLGCIGVLYLVQLVNVLLGYRLNILGIYPRHPLGLFGIVFSPFLHGDFNHLFFNSIPLFVLAGLILISGKPVFYCVTAVIVVSSGLGVWLFGRKALHVGASSLIMGYWSYLLLNAIEQRTAMAIVLGVVSVYYFGGLFFDLFPSEVEVSWEGHLFGFLAGLLASYVCASGLLGFVV